MNTALALLLTVASLGASADDTQYRTDSGQSGSVERYRDANSDRVDRDAYDREGRHRRDGGHYYSPDRERRDSKHPSPRVEVHVDGLLTNDQSQRAPKRSDDSGPSSCRQAHSAAWSTRQLDCPNPRPAQRSNVWSTQ